MLEIMINSIKDLFDKKILLSSLIPIVISAIFGGIFVYIIQLLVFTHFNLKRLKELR